MIARTQPSDSTSYSEARCRWSVVTTFCGRHSYARLFSFLICGLRNEGGKWPNEKEISHGRVSRQTRRTCFAVGRWLHPSAPEHPHWMSNEKEISHGRVLWQTR